MIEIITQEKDTKLLYNISILSHKSEQLIEILRIYKHIVLKQLIFLWFEIGGCCTGSICDEKPADTRISTCTGNLCNTMDPR